MEDFETLLTNLVDGPLGAWYLRKKDSRMSVKEVTSHMLREYLLDNNEHPAKVFTGFFSAEFPQAVLTYEWKMGLSSVSDVLQDPKVLNHPDLLRDPKVRRGRNGMANPRVWVDILFIDQLAKNIPVELGVAQEYYILCIVHIIAGSQTLLQRGWCIWELGLRAHAKKESLIIGLLAYTVRFTKAMEINLLRADAFCVSNRMLIMTSTGKWNCLTKKIGRKLSMDSSEYLILMFPASMVQLLPRL